MLGRPEWFTYRSAGWGIAPRTWQGWAYIGGFVLMIVALGQLPVSGDVRNVLVGTLVALFAIDAAVIWTQLGGVHDERQRLHQLIIERNCSVAAVLTVVAAGFAQASGHAILSGSALPFDPWLLVVLGVMALTKLVSTLFLRWRM